jgi:hypothetical protein
MTFCTIENDTFTFSGKCNFCDYIFDDNNQYSIHDCNSIDGTYRLCLCSDISVIEFAQYNSRYEKIFINLSYILIIKNISDYYNSKNSFNEIIADTVSIINSSHSLEELYSNINLLLLFS